MLEFSKKILIKVSFDKSLFKKELKPIIKTIQHDGYNTLQSIADELTKRKITTRFGKTKWHPSQVRNYLDK